MVLSGPTDQHPYDGAVFSGAKIVLISGGDLLTYKRDDKPTIPFPGQWDLPGGAREGAETPVECAIRETREEFGLSIDPGAVVWQRPYPGLTPGAATSWFLVARLPGGAFADVTFGDEGERWDIMPIGAFLDHPEAVGPLKARLRAFLAQASD